jgi:hypothetical protein
MQRYYLIMEVKDCSERNLQSVKHVTQFMSNLSRLTNLRTLLDAIVVERKHGVFGLTAFLPGENMHITLDSFPLTAEMTLHIHSYFPLEMISIRKEIMTHFSVPSTSIFVVVQKGHESQVVECAEKGCFQLARKEWNGREVCLQHYTDYTDLFNQHELDDDN